MPSLVREAALQLLLRLLQCVALALFVVQCHLQPLCSLGGRLQPLLQIAYLFPVRIRGRLHLHA